MFAKDSTKKPRRFIRRSILDVAALATVVVLFLFLGRSAMEPSLKSQVDAAETAYEAGNFTQAEAVYLKAKELAPGNARILARLGEISLWNNRPDDAERYFGEALRNTPWYVSTWPLTTQLKYRLAMTYYRQDRFEQASRYFREAAGPIHLGPFKTLESLSRFTGLFTNENSYMIEGPEQSRVDFKTTDPLPVVPVSINGSYPLNFIIDTGGAEVVLSKSVADQLGVKTIGSFPGSFAGQKQVDVGLGKADTLRIGDYIVRNIPTHVLDPEDPIIMNGLKVDGVIGTRLLMHFLSTIDYSNGALILRKIDPENLKDLETEIAASDAKVIPFWLIDMHVIVAEGTFNNQAPALFYVDTGLTGKGFTAPEPVLQAAGITVDWTRATDYVGGGGKIKATDIVIDRLTLGTGANEIVQNTVPGLVQEKTSAPLNGELGFQVTGLISHQFFRKHALTFDFTSMRMIVQ